MIYTNQKGETCSAVDITNQKLLNSMESKSSYKSVETLETGQTIVNLGIIKQIYPHKNGSVYQILFDPQRELKSKSMWYKRGDKLMCA